MSLEPEGDWSAESEVEEEVESSSSESGDVTENKPRPAGKKRGIFNGMVWLMELPLSS
jgi:hypothetical protein